MDTSESSKISSLPCVLTLAVLPREVRSGEAPRVLGSLLPSLRAGGGACKTWAAVGPLCPAPLTLGGVTVPPRTGNSSARGTRCCGCGLVDATFLLPLIPLGCLGPCWNFGLFPASLECDRLEPSTPFLCRVLSCEKV